MRDRNVITVLVETDKIKLSPNESAMRLKIPRSYTNDAIIRCENELNKVICYKYAYIKVPIVFKAENICNIGFNIESKNLCKTLCDCNYAYILGATIGIGADRLISRLSVTSPSDAFITDALASVAVESLCDYADNLLRGNEEKPFRYSAGYGDMPLSYQTEILKLLNADYTLGINLNSSLLMTPKKSVTAIMGVL